MTNNTALHKININCVVTNIQRIWKTSIYTLI